MEPPLLGYYKYFSGSKCVFAQGHNRAEVGIQPRLVRGSTTRPPRSSKHRLHVHVLTKIRKISQTFIINCHYCSCKNHSILHRHVNKIMHMYNMSRVMRKPAFCICENKDADQLRGNHKADQRLCFHYMDSTIPRLF